MFDLFHRAAWSHTGRTRAMHEPPDTGSGQACPHCQSTRTEPRHVARRIGGAVGAAAGAGGAVAVALSGAEAGAAAGMIGGPLGSVAGAILAGFVAGAAGCATGAAFGDTVDQKVLDNWRCLACGHTFSIQPR